MLKSFNIDLDYITKAKIEYKINTLLGRSNKIRYNYGLKLIRQSRYAEIDGYELFKFNKKMSLVKFNKAIIKLEKMYPNIFVLVDKKELYIKKEKILEFIQDVILPEKFKYQLIKELIYFKLIHKPFDNYININQDKLDNIIYIPFCENTEYLINLFNIIGIEKIKENYIKQINVYKIKNLKDTLSMLKLLQLL